MTSDPHIELFQRVMLINLRRRPDRLASFFGQDEMKSWPFRAVDIHDACDGWAAPLPPGWNSGSGSYGCRNSHVAVLRKAIEDGIDSIFVLEDDAFLCPRFTERAASFLAILPSDWDALFLGGQHRGRRETSALGVTRCFNVQRTHAYALRGKCIKGVCNLWAGMTTGHIDHRAGDWQPQWNVYAPDPFLIGQAGGKSDIRCVHEPLRFWSNVPGVNQTATGRTKHKHIRLCDTIAHYAPRQTTLETVAAR